jgi:hypothetical protein
MISDYIVIPKQFVNKRQFQQIGVNMFHAVQALDGRWVVSANALNEFADFFAEYSINTQNVNVVQLDSDTGFPQYDINGNRIN